MTLYQLNHQFEQILEMAETGEFEEDVIRGTLECVEGEIEEKLFEIDPDLREIRNLKIRLCMIMVSPTCLYSIAMFTS